MQIKIRRIIKWLIGVVFLIGMLLGILTVNSLEEKATVSTPESLNAKEISRVKNIFFQINSASLKSDEPVNSQISEQDLNLLLNYIYQTTAGPLKGRINSKVVLGKNQANIGLSLRLPENLAGRYLNISADIESVEVKKRNDSADLVEIKTVSVGQYLIPAILVGPLVKFIHTQMKFNIEEYNLLSRSLKNINFSEHELSVDYMLDKKVAESLKLKLGSRVISDTLKQAIMVYSNKLSYFNYRPEIKSSLNELIKPMFKEAKERSKFNDPVTENKAVFIALTAYILNRNIYSLLDNKNQIKTKSKKIYLKGRVDLSKHLLISAAITSMANSSLAESIGLEKEIIDAQGRSGFSFTDLAADHAGIRLAEYAIANEQQARKIQDKMSAIESEADYMPAIDNLPESLSKNEFNKSYLNSEEYRAFDKLIKMRIDKLEIYK